MSETRYQVGDRVWFLEQARPYKVQAISASGRYLVCTKPFSVKRTVLYTVVDEECEHAAAMFDAQQFTFSQRRKPIRLRFARRVGLSLIDSNHTGHRIITTE